MQLPRIYKCIIRLQSSMMIRKDRSFKFKYSRSKKIAERLLIYYFTCNILLNRVHKYPAPLTQVHADTNLQVDTRTRAPSRRKIATRVHVVLMKNDILRSFVGYSRIPRILKNSHVPCPSSITRKNFACIFIDKQPTRLIASAERAISRRRRLCNRLKDRAISFANESPGDELSYDDYSKRMLLRKLSCEFVAKSKLIKCT